MVCPQVDIRAIVEEYADLVQFGICWGGQKGFCCREVRRLHSEVCSKQTTLPNSVAWTLHQVWLMPSWKTSQSYRLTNAERWWCKTRKSSATPNRDAHTKHMAALSRQLSTSFIDSRSGDFVRQRVWAWNAKNARPFYLFKIMGKN